MESIAKINFSPKSFFLKSEIEMYGLLGGLGILVLGFPCLENDMQNMLELCI